MKTDILIVGSGCAGLYCAFNLPKDKKITIITKAGVEENDSFLAQGGMCMLRDEADYASFFADTMKAGHYENDEKSVEIMIRSSKAVVEDLLSIGADFDKDEKGELAFTKEGAHSAKRIIFHKDITGREITGTLLKEVMTYPNVTILPHTTLIDIIEEDNMCYGAVIKNANDSIETIGADYVIMATGGVGGIYKHSTNFRHLTGDAIAIAIKHGVKLKDMPYVQIHPTTLYADEERSFLISESVRGEGAVLRDKDGNRFVNELLPRDLLTIEIYKQMEKDGTDYVWEDLRMIPEDELRKHFPNIMAHCLKMGYDVTKECIPVVPAQHYFMGGIWVDYLSKTSMDRLYAVGETACNGVHGKNRLASNSLLESLVFAKRAAKDIEENYVPADKDELIEQTDIMSYNDISSLMKEYQDMVRKEIDAK
ncbi:MAG: L-aspartate oxidase [Lachnospiraceae bacterium]|nr:L-aspartate oxidase [Lachnospiraceae bacterium]